MRFVTAVPAPDFGVVTLKEFSGSGVIELQLNGTALVRFAGNTVSVSKTRVNAAGLTLTYTDGSSRETIL